MALNRIDTVGDYIIIRNRSIFKDIQSISSITEDLDFIDVSSIRRYFRFSENGAEYSDWYLYSLDIMNETLPLELNKTFSIDFKYELISEGYIQFNSITYNTIPIDLKIQSVPYTVYEVWNAGSKHQPLPEINYTLDIYNQSQSLNLNKDLSFIANSILGHTVSYFKADPLQESRDSILLEWGLMQYRNGKYIKLVVPDNDFPSSDFNLTPIEGLNFEMPFEVHIDKRYYESVFGYTQRPAKDDAIFFDRTDRMYLVADCEIVRSFMNEPVYYKCNLVKYERKSYISATPQTESILQGALISMDDIFGGDIAEQTLDVTNVKQLQPKGKEWDMIRIYKPEKYNDIITYYNLQNYDTTISNSYYNLQTPFNSDGAIEFINYNMKDVIKPTNNRTYTAWVYLKSEKIDTKSVKNVEITGDDIRINFMYGSPKVNQHEMLILHNSDLDIDVRVKVVSINNTKEDSYIHATFDNATYKAQVETFTPDWYNSTNITAKRVERYNLLNNMNVENQGMSIDIESSTIILRLDDNEYKLELDNSLLTDKWYGIVFGILNEFKQLTSYIYEMDENNKSNELKLFTYKNITFDLTTEIAGNETMYVNASPMLLTNLRWMSENIIQEKQSMFLNQAIVSNSSKCMIIDNAEPRSTLPYIGSVK